MPSGSYLQVYVKCPFYRSDNGKTVIDCEGVIPDTTARNAFARQEDFRLHVELFCCNEFDKCEYYRAVREKYEEE